MKELVNYNEKLVNEIENYNDNIHGTMKFEDGTGNGLDLNEFDSSINFLSNIFSGKTSIDEALIEQTRFNS